MPRTQRVKTIADVQEEKRRLRRQRDGEILKLRKQGWSLEEIAVRFLLSREMVRLICQHPDTADHNVRKARKEELEKRFKKAVGRKKTIHRSEVGKKLGVSARTIARLARRLGVELADERRKQNRRRKQTGA